MKFRRPTMTIGSVMFLPARSADIIQTVQSWSSKFALVVEKGFSQATDRSASKKAGRQMILLVKPSVTRQTYTILKMVLGFVGTIKIFQEFLKLFQLFF